MGNLGDRRSVHLDLDSEHRSVCKLQLLYHLGSSSPHPSLAILDFSQFVQHMLLFLTSGTAYSLFWSNNQIAPPRGSQGSSVTHQSRSLCPYSMLRFYLEFLLSGFTTPGIILVCCLLCWIINSTKVLPLSYSTLYSPTQKSNWYSTC